MPDATSRRPLISGNWKMNLNHFEAIQLVQKLAFLLDEQDTEAVDVSLHPPFTDIRSVQTLIDADDIPVALGAQHCHWEASGAYTGAGCGSRRPRPRTLPACLRWRSRPAIPAWFWPESS